MTTTLETLLTDLLATVTALAEEAHTRNVIELGKLRQAAGWTGDVGASIAEAEIRLEETR